MSRGVIAVNPLVRNVQQRESHTHLSRDVSLFPAPSLRSRSGRLDAVIVPASRPASFLQPAIELAAFLEVLLVVLCSKQTKPEQVATRIARTPGARSLIIPISDGWEHPCFPKRTSEPAFRLASAGRVSDLSLKRNLGLLVARLHGWNKVAFVDDDITLSRTGSIARLAGQLDDHQVAGMLVLQHPDNSVVCHARRLAGLRQGVFVTGAVLGVHCGDLPLSFFPDIYNEDWFFFAKEAAARDLPRVGHARQAYYDPFASPDRARMEEFGDLMAEGLYALIGDEDPSMPFDDEIRAATEAYWSRFIEARRQVLTTTMTLLAGFLDRDPDNSRVLSAVNSLAAAESQLNIIEAGLCVNFVNAWRDDLDDWQRFSNGMSNLRSTHEAMDFLELKSWILAEFGAAVDFRRR